MEKWICMKNMHIKETYKPIVFWMIPAMLGVLHGVVDLTTVSSVLWTSFTLHGFDLLTPFILISGYDLLAFGLQAPFGVVSDRYNLTRPALVIGLIFVLLSAISIPGGWATLAFAGIGNALFHLSAGALVLSHSQGRAAAAGIFVAPGALGLGLGTWLSHAMLPTWLFAIPILMTLIIVLRIFKKYPMQVLYPDHHLHYQEILSQDRRMRYMLLIASLLLASIAIRSFVGLGGCWQCQKTGDLMILLPLAGFLGKLTGGLFADRFGWIETSIGALLISTPLLSLSGGSLWASIPGLLIFQATMPITLTAMYYLIPSRPCTAFGLTCLALIAGAVITFIPAGKALFSAGLFILLIPLSALFMYLALTLLGIPLSYRPGLLDPDDEKRK